MNDYKQDYLIYAAKKAFNRPEYIGYILNRYIKLESLDHKKIREMLSCSESNYYHLVLCRVPEIDSELFSLKIRKISSAHNVEAHALAKIIRHVCSIEYLQSANTQEQESILLAARDKSDDASNE